MADQPKQTGKRGRPKLRDSERKRRKLQRKKSFEKTRIYIGNKMDRWNDVKRAHNLANDHEVATLLLDRYLVQRDVMPGPSKLTPAQRIVQAETHEIPSKSRLTSTPGIEEEINVVSTPSVSGVSAAETEPVERDDPLDVMSGLEEIESSEESTTQFKVSTKGKQSSRPHAMKKLSSSFIDPYDISIDITHVDIEGDSDERLSDGEDPDYEPSILISSILPKELEEQCEDVAFEEAEFGLENEGDEPVEEDQLEEDTLLEGISYIKTADDCDSATSALKCICFVDQLKQLAKLKCEKCTTCTSTEVEIEETFVGSAIYLKWVCKEGHVSLRWCSQPLLNRRMHCGDFLICSTILTSGNNFGKMKLWASMLHTKFPSASQFHAIQGKYLVPTIDGFWSQHQTENLTSFQNDEVIVLGDGRNDSPGHNAQYCSYTFMEQETKKILTLKTMDKRLTDRKSTNMEKASFQAGIKELAERGISVKEVVTDAHLGIGVLMRTNYQHVKHSHDIWHVAKNLGKKLSKIAQRKGNNLLHQWNKDIVNHFWFTCKTAESYGQFLGIWSGVLHHIVNEHEWILSHGGDGTYQCLHGSLSEEDRSKPWLNPKTHKHILKDLANVILDKRLLKNIPFYLNFRSTADLEGFHQHILMYCAKRFSYSPAVYRVRNLLTALDHNMNLERPDARKKDGSLRLHRVWNKKSGRWSVYPVKEAKSYKYIDEMLKSALQLRLADHVGMYRPRELEKEDPRRLSRHLAPISPKPTIDIHAEQLSRFK